MAAKFNDGQGMITNNETFTVGDAATFTVTLFAEQQGHHCGHRDKDEIAFEGSDTVRIVE